MFLPGGTEWSQRHLSVSNEHTREALMGRGILLWLLGVPIPIIILLVLFMR